MSALTQPEFDRLEQALQTGGAERVFDVLIAGAREEKNYRLLFSARLMQARHRMGLPLIDTEPAPRIPEELRPVYQKALEEAARETGELFLACGDIPSAWPYFKAIGDSAPVAAALEKVTNGENLERLVEIAFQEGVHPRKGFELILEHRGICSAITWFSANRDYESRQECLKLLIRTLYQQIARAIEETVVASEGPQKASGSIAELMEGRPWLFEGNSYYVDSTHLTAILRFSPELEDRETLRMAVELADYGNALAPMYHFRGEPPFEDTYRDCGVYLRALLGEDVDGAIAHFRSKAATPAPIPGDTTSAEVLIELLVRVGRYPEAIEASLEYFPDPKSTPASCPSIMQLCEMAHDYQKLRTLSQERGDLLGFAAGVIQGRGL